MLYRYKDNKTYCKCTCDCGNENIIVPMNRLKAGDRKSCGCIMANHESKKRLKNDYNRKDLIGMKFGYLTVIEASERRTKSGGIVWRCVCDCGNYHFAPSRDLQANKVQSCGCKRSSQYEDVVENTLIALDIHYIKQKMFSDCRNKNPLPFDFYLPDQNVCIECQGQQHYIPVDYFGGTDKLLRQQQNDLIKYNYCNSNGILLLQVIYYMSSDEIRTLIANVINPVTITA